jgi:DNA recombination protein RmuC
VLARNTFIQKSHATDEGQRLRPDVVVNLPEGKKIVVDSKLSLVAFNEHVNADNDAERAVQLKRHLFSIRSHIKALSGKEYPAAASQLDYVVMFIPIEGALAVALREDPSLTAEAVAANVAIATPTTLMIALRTVANVWQVERRNRNAETIAQRAGKIYDKLVGFIDDMVLRGTRLAQAQTSYGEAMSKLSSGRGNLTNQVAQLKELGAKSSKTIPPHLLDESENENSTLKDCEPVAA